MDDLMAFREAMSKERVAAAVAVVRRRRNGRVVNMVVVKLEGVLWGGYMGEGFGDSKKALEEYCYYLSLLFKLVKCLFTSLQVSSWKFGA